MIRVKQSKNCLDYKISIIIFAFCLLFSVFGFSLIHPSSVLAVGTASAKSKGLTLSPLRSELEVAPGTSVEGILKVTNSTTAVMTVSFSAEEFSVINQQYDYAFTAESDTAKWVTFNTIELVLAVGESKNISYRVGAPLTAEPGGRYISLFVSTDTNSSESVVNSRQRVASLLYINVTGSVTRKGKLLSLNSPWLLTGKGQWSATIQNSGTTHFRSRYNVAIQNLIGGGTVSEGSGDALILPGSIRAISDEIALPKWPGLYKAVYSIGLGDTPFIPENRYILYCPPSVAATIVVIITFLVFWVIRKRKKSN